MAEFFTDVTERIPYEGPESDNPLAFHWYDADRVVAGRTMQDQLRFAGCQRGGKQRLRTLVHVDQYDPTRVLRLRRAQQAP